MVSLFLLKFHTPEAVWVGAGELLAVTPTFALCQQPKPPSMPSLRPTVT